MHEDHPPGSDQRSWLERLGQSLVGEPADREELIDLLRNAERRALLDVDALSMIEGALQVTEMQARDIMIPRVQMETLNDDDDLEQMLDVITSSGHSRFPVMSEKKDTVRGILLAKDLLRYLKPSDTREFELGDVLRTPVVVPESKRLNTLLNEFRHSRNHMAIVVDEYGVAAGLVTIEDVLEQIVGEIDDEHDMDEVENAILRKDDNRYTVKALTPVEDFNDFFGCELDDGLDTIGGLLAKQLGHLPKVGETVELGEFDFSVVKADGRRVHLLEMTTQIAPAIPT